MAAIPNVFQDAFVQAELPLLNVDSFRNNLVVFEERLRRTTEAFEVSGHY